jgi:protease I
VRRIGILLADLFDEREFIYPYYRVLEAGFSPLVIGPEAKEYRAKSGLAWKAEATPSQEAGSSTASSSPGGSPPIT